MRAAVGTTSSTQATTSLKMSSEVGSSTGRRCHVPENLAVGFIGAGRMAQALSKGFIHSGLIKASDIIASDPNPNMLAMIKESSGIETTENNEKVVWHSQLVIVAVKPNMVSTILRDISSMVTQEHLIVSIAAGITIRGMEQELPPKTRVIRVMPNTPAMVGAAATVVSPGSSVLEGDAPLVQELFKSIGLCEVAPETLLDAVTGVSGSGPAYAFAIIEALSDGGVKMGLPRDLAQNLAAQTLFGAAKMVMETGRHPGELKDAVCSPGGTTISAMHGLEKAGLRGILMDAVENATLRSVELGKHS